MAARKKSGAASREIAIYLRLSSADGTEAESNSIGNQRSYLHQWAAREGWQIVAEFWMMATRAPTLSGPASAR